MGPTDSEITFVKKIKAFFLASIYTFEGVQYQKSLLSNQPSKSSPYPKSLFSFSYKASFPPSHPSAISLSLPTSTPSSIPPQKVINPPPFSTCSPLNILYNSLFTIEFYNPPLFNSHVILSLFFFWKFSHCRLWILLKWPQHHLRSLR